jgi:hypothetical protein
MIFGMQVQAAVGAASSGPVLVDALSGTVDIEPMVWQLIAVPSRYGWWNSTTHALVYDNTIAKVAEYVIDQLEDLYGTGCVTICAAFPGDVNAFLSFNPASTPRNSVHNFDLMYLEEDMSFETNGFWLKSNNMDPMVLSFTEWRAAP